MSGIYAVVWLVVGVSRQSRRAQKQSNSLGAYFIVGFANSQLFVFQEGRLPLHYAGALGTEPDGTICYSLLLEHGANEMTMDGEEFN